MSDLSIAAALQAPVPEVLAEVRLHPLDAFQRAEQMRRQTKTERDALQGAACRAEGLPVSLFYSEGRNDTENMARLVKCRAVCGRCPVEAFNACLVDSFRLQKDLKGDGDVGLWAGLTERDRYRVRRWRAKAVFRCRSCGLWSTHLPRETKVRCSSCLFESRQQRRSPA